MKILLIVALFFGSLWGYAMDYDKESECVVRKLKVHKDPQWVSKIELTNGKKLFFSSPKSMIEFYHQPGRWYDIGVKSEDDFKELLVTDYNTLKPIDAKGAFYVYGSSITSPAGDDLVPFASYEDAKTFAQKNNGKRVLSFKEIKESLIRLLNNRI
ncbi:MAG: nitrous oxide reductase accessory protein NosL [Sulfurimonas sp.]|uniref:nitrous oxide reductase accessory protein NosL n=1 Tax=Sulfurimonas sp. TaxID=2022749 RepID=UPI002624ED8D|nr:nitrous oxide reductase accessory protein NosL [Sulfurimonas sp.]MDD2652151.1 nitrous oxide reductase accessory protein NosL [Sulfurimonas sp.]MDD3450566.1 nitrous oxide reductase accessory protein NosL [Sulfurimonas sp.]